MPLSSAQTLSGTKHWHTNVAWLHRTYYPTGMNIFGNTAGKCHLANVKAEIITHFTFTKEVQHQTNNKCILASCSCSQKPEQCKSVCACVCVFQTEIQREMKREYSSNWIYRDSVWRSPTLLLKSIKAFLFLQTVVIKPTNTSWHQSFLSKYL